MEFTTETQTTQSKPRGNPGFFSVFLCVLCVSVVIAAQTPAPWLIKSGDSVFFVGNSFFNYTNRDLAEWVTAIGKAGQPPVTINTGTHIVYGTQPLSWFFQQPASQNAIKSGKYKVFVIQGEEREPVENKAGFHQAVRDYNTAVKAKGGSVMLFMTWDFAWEKDTAFFKTLSAAYEEIGKELKIPVIPVGLIYDDANAQPFANQRSYWLTGQQLHQVESGTAVNAYATFAMLTGINPMGRPFTAAGNTNSPEMLKYLSDKTWTRVAPRLSGTR
jgi:hypothetical protein